MVKTEDSWRMASFVSGGRVTMSIIDGGSGYSGCSVV